MPEASELRRVPHDGRLARIGPGWSSTAVRRTEGSMLGASRPTIRVTHCDPSAPSNSRVIGSRTRRESP